MEVKVSIVIPTFNNLELTKKCLFSLRANTDPSFLDDVIVVDNLSEDGTREFLKKQDWLKTVFNPKNLGFSKASNIGAEKAKGDILILLNNDTETGENWIAPLLEVLKKKGAAAVAPKLLFPNGKVQHAGIVISNDKIPRHIYYGSDPGDPFVNKEREFQAVTAACLAVKKEIFTKIGGFDEKYVNGLEDVDLCLKIKEKGYRIFYCPESIVVHHESVSEGRFNRTGQNEKYFLSKWGGKITPDEEKYYREDGFGWFFRKHQNLKNIMLRRGGEKRSLIFLMFRIVYVFVYRVFFGIGLMVRLDFKTLSKKIKKVLYDKS